MMRCVTVLLVAAAVAAGGALPGALHAQAQPDAEEEATSAFVSEVRQVVVRSENGAAKAFLGAVSPGVEVSYDCIGCYANGCYGWNCKSVTPAYPKCCFNKGPGWCGKPGANC